MTLREELEKLLPEALYLGISEAEYWQMTVGEITRAVKAAHDRDEHQAKLSRVTAYNTASLVASFVRRAFDGSDIPDLAEVFPEFMVDPDEQEAKEAEVLKQRFMAFAEEANKRRHS